MSENIKNVRKCKKCHQVAEKSSNIPNLQGIIGTKTFEEVLIAPGKFLVKLNSLDDFWTKVLLIF